MDIADQKSKNLQYQDENEKLNDFSAKTAEDLRKEQYLHENCQNNLTDLEDDYSELERQFKAATDNVKVLTSCNNELNSVSQRTKQDLQLMTKDLTQKLDLYENVNDEKESLKNVNQALTSNVDKLSSQNMRLKQANSKILEESQEYIVDNENLNSLIENLKDEIEKMDDMIGTQREESNKMIDTLTQELDSINKKHDITKTQNNDLKEA